MGAMRVQVKNSLSDLALPARFFALSFSLLLISSKKRIFALFLTPRVFPAGLFALCSNQIPRALAAVMAPACLACVMNVSGR